MGSNLKRKRKLKETFKSREEWWVRVFTTSMTYRIFLLLILLFGNGCFMGMDEKDRLYVKYGTIPELNESKMYLFSRTIPYSAPEAVLETFPTDKFYSPCLVPSATCCVGSVGFIIDLVVLPFQVVYGALTYPFTFF